MFYTETPKNILICPLNWGLGHATRCVPIIQLLKNKPCNILVASSGNAYYYLKKVFPELTHIWFEDYDISYSKKESQNLKLFWQLPKLLYKILDEHSKLKKLISSHNIDVVISDNRFGLWNNKIKSIYITHQIHIQAPVNYRFTKKLLYLAHRFFIKKYNHCWIPDLPGKFKLAGALSATDFKDKNCSYIGILSRFSKQLINDNPTQDLCVVISGPEPQRSIFQEIVFKQLQNSALSAVVVLGKPNESQDYLLTPTIRVLSSADISTLEGFICSSSYVLARAGYSTIMDLAATGIKAILVPTPGQTEQEYLANRLGTHRYFLSKNQQEINILEAIEAAAQTSGLYLPVDTAQLDHFLDNVIFY